jgi:hypothetical protein
MQGEQSVVLLIQMSIKRVQEDGTVEAHAGLKEWVWVLQMILDK